MGIIRSGVLGNTRGKIGGVVGGQWKDKNYLREYVKPANPDTPAQQTQRALMSSCVAFAKALVGPIFNAYTDKFQKSMSGFNFFIKSNITLFTAVPTLSSVLISEGKLSPISNFACTYDTATGAFACTWVANKGNNGADTDKVFWAIYDKSDGRWRFAPSETDRSILGDTDTIAAGLTVGDLSCYALVAQYSGTLVSLISDSVYDQVEAP